MPEIIAHEAQGRSEMLVGPTSTSAWPSTTGLSRFDQPAALDHDRGDPRLDRQPAAHGFERSISSTATAATSPPSEAAFSEIYSEGSYLGRPRGYSLKLRTGGTCRG